MDFITVVSLTIFVATVGTIVMALVSYGGFKVREWRKPRAQGTGRTLEAGRTSTEDEFLFFTKYVPPPEEPVERES